MVNMVGALIRVGCQSVCKFALRHGDLNQFARIGENIIRSTMKAVYRPVLMKDVTKEKKVSFRTATDFSAEPSAGVGPAPPVLTSVPGALSSIKLNTASGSHQPGSGGSHVAIPQIDTLLRKYEPLLVAKTLTYGFVGLWSPCYVFNIASGVL